MWVLGRTCRFSDLNEAASLFLQVVLSKAREHTVLVCAACSFALPIQHQDLSGARKYFGIYIRVEIYNFAVARFGRNSPGVGQYGRTATNLYAPARWQLDFEHQSVTIVFLEPNDTAGYQAIVRITNESLFDILVKTAHGVDLGIPHGYRRGPFFSIDVSSTRVDIAPLVNPWVDPRAFKPSIGGTYQILCCSSGQPMHGA
jgi:hypothetical protein